MQNHQTQILEIFLNAGVSKNNFLSSWIGNEINPNWPEKLKKHEKILNNNKETRV